MQSMPAAWQLLLVSGRRSSLEPVASRRGRHLRLLRLRLGKQVCLGNLGKEGWWEHLGLDIEDMSMDSSQGMRNEFGRLESSCSIVGGS